MNDLGLQFFPTSALADFKTAVNNSGRDVFPGITTKGCFFHLTQAVWRTAQITGLQITYREDDNVKKLIRRAAVLPLVPLDSIEDVFFQALEDRDEADPREVTETFTDYVTEQWVNGDNRLIWNNFGTNGPRTNNNLEAWPYTRTQTSTLSSRSSRTSITAKSFYRSRNKQEEPFVNRQRRTRT